MSAQSPVAAALAARAEALVDLAALRANLAELRRLAGGREVIAVVKADAYGHGAPAVARALEADGVTRLAVMSAGEAAELRTAGVRASILLLGGLERPEDAAAIAELDATAVVQHLDQIAPLAAAGARRGTPIAVQVEVDTGMSRMGIPAGEAIAALERIAAQGGLRLDGVYTHPARADETELGSVREQLARFARVLGEARARGIATGLVHVANSAALLAAGDLAAALPPEVNAVRPGIALYGVRSAAHFATPLRPVMTLRGRVVNVRRVAAGDPVGYGGTWRAARATSVATVALGYADGVPWSLGGSGGEMGLGSRRVPIVGRISMDLTTLDAGGAPVALGDTAVAFGDGGPTVEEMAARAGTIPWEILVRVGRRVGRRTVGEGAAAPT
ncbi:MAG TPA: alanine racemase [Myxococcota bacterium]|nr:alanine racemase [Myxococcota bacterium]